MAAPGGQGVPAGGPGDRNGPTGPPYRPNTQALGGTPDVLPDIPINAVFLALFIAAAVGHMGLFKVNMKRGRKFVFNAMTFGFCLTRIIATSIRIAWSVYPRNISVGIAAMIFVYAGIILLFIANLFFAQRIVRAQHPHVGWSKPVSLFLPILVAIIIGTIFCLIAAVIVQFYVLNGERTALKIQKFGSTFFAITAFLPIPIVAASSLARLNPTIRKTKTIDKFGEGSMRAKIAIVLVSAFFLTLGATYRAATTLIEPIALLEGQPPRPAPIRPYLSKAAFYVFNFTIEISIVFFWLAIRIDKRFYIPDGARGPGSYAGGFVFAGEAGNEKRRSARHLTSARSSMNTASRDRTSYISTSTNRTRSVESRISWGGISRDNVAPMYAEDGVATVPYSGIDDAEPAEQWDAGFSGAEQEMGWDPKSGKWALRPISRRRSQSQSLRDEGSDPEEVPAEGVKMDDVPMEGAFTDERGRRFYRV